MPFARDLDQGRRVVDVGVGDPHAEFHVSPTSPATGAHENELPLRQQLIEVADRTSHGDQVVALGKLAILERIDVDEMGDGRQATV